MLVSEDFPDAVCVTHIRLIETDGLTDYFFHAPQSFRLGDILAAHEKIRARPEGYTDMVDQATICWTLGIPIHLVRGNRGNVKITTPEDIVMLSALLDWQKRRS